MMLMKTLVFLFFLAAPQIIEVRGNDFFLKLPDDGWMACQVGVTNFKGCRSVDKNTAFSGAMASNDDLGATLEFSWAPVVDDRAGKKRSARTALNAMLQADLVNGGKKRSGIAPEAGGSRLSYTVEFKDDDGMVTRNRVTIFAAAYGDDYAVVAAGFPVESEAAVRSGLKKILASLVFIEPDEGETEPE